MSSKTQNLSNELPELPELSGSYYWRVRHYVRDGTVIELRKSWWPFSYLVGAQSTISTNEHIVSAAEELKRRHTIPKNLFNGNYQRKKKKK